MVRNHLRGAVVARNDKRASQSTPAGGRRRGAEEPSKTGKVDVGARLKALRMERNLSQRDLAASSGVTNGMISMIEQNKHSPSVATLNRITDALGIRDIAMPATPARVWEAYRAAAPAMAAE